MEDLVEEISTLHQIQAMDGNWDHSAYMLGVYNGLELVMSIIESRDPQYRNPPEVFDVDRVTIRREPTIKEFQNV